MLGGLDNSGDDWDEQLEGVTVFQDNARILPNSMAKSMPPVPFPPAGPESPRAVEGKNGISFITPRHKRLDSLPEALPLDDLSLGDEEDQNEDLEASSQELLPPPEDMDEDLDTKPPPASSSSSSSSSSPPPPRRSSSTPRTKRRSSLKTPTPFVPQEQRVFPKNQPRRGRNAPNNPEVRRSQSSVEVKEDEGQTKEHEGAKDYELTKGHSSHSLN
jgi:hypothetical protein